MIPWFLMNQTRQASSRALSVASEIQALGSEVDIRTQGLERRVRQLEIVCAGLWTLLQDKVGCEEEDLVAAITAAAEAGAHKEGGDLQACPNCGRKPVIRNALVCSWCGKSLVSQLPGWLAPEDPEESTPSRASDR